MNSSFGGIAAYIMAGVAGLISALVVIYTWVPQIEAIDRYALHFRVSCEIGSERFLRMYGVDEAGDLDPDKYYGEISNLEADNDGNDCTGITKDNNSHASASPKGIVSEHGVKIGPALTTAGEAVTLNSGSKIRKPPGVTQAYDGISLLIMGVMPILNSAGFLAVTGFNIFFLVRGVAGIHVTIIATIGALILSILAMNFGPTFINGIDTIYQTPGGQDTGSADDGEQAHGVEHRDEFDY